MKIVIAPDSFKESMTAVEAAEHIEKAIKKVDETVTTVKVPLADGGEGTVDALVHSQNGKVVTHTVTGPLGDKITARYGIIHDKIAVIEIAAVVGLSLVPAEKRNPMKTTTYGIGELIDHALNQGIRSFFIGLGGSCTNDGGIGMAQALGAEIVNKDGEPVTFGGDGLAQVASVSIKGLDERLKQCTFQVASDVTNPLTGPDGATYIYGPQKGATNEMLARLDKAMRSYAAVLKRDVGIDVTSTTGAGAAGGLGAACIAFFGATLTRGIDLLAEMTNIEAHIKSADLVITGEGKIDDQTMFGKTPVGVANMAKNYGVPVIAMTGANKITSPNIYETGITAIFPIINEPMDLQKAMKESTSNIEKATENIIRLFLAKRRQ